MFTSPGRTSEAVVPERQGRPPTPALQRGGLGFPSGVTERVWCRVGRPAEAARGCRYVPAGWSGVVGGLSVAEWVSRRSVVMP